MTIKKTLNSAVEINLDISEELARITSRLLFLRQPQFPRTALFALLLAAGATAHAAGINDTGIDFCGDDTDTANCATVGADGGTHPRQDARYGRDAAAAAGQLTKVGGGGKGFDFTKIANDGSVLPESAALGSNPTDWACTRDNVTGLIWEVKTASGLRGQSYTYTWYNSNAATNFGNVGNAGTASGGTCFATGRCDTEKFAADINAAGLCGASGWRMPALKELEGIVDLGRVNPAIDPTYFPNTPSSHFWSGSPSAYSSTYAWSVGFYYGSASHFDYASYSYGVRLVAAVATAPTASAVSISGVAYVGQLLTGSYTYADTNNDPQGTSTFRWLRNGTAITGATASTYTLVSADQGTTITFEVTPVATVEPTTGTPVVSGATATVTVTVLPSGYIIQGGLIWMPVTFSNTWANANAYCANTTINGQTGWRLPTQTELSALYISGAMNGQGWTLDGTWSSTPYSTGFHYGVFLTYGGVGWFNDTYNVYVTTCVR